MSVQPRSLGIRGPEALVVQDGPGACVTHGGRSGSARDPPAWEPPPPPLSPGRSLWPNSHHSLRCICLCTFPPALAFLEAGTLFFFWGGGGRLILTQC